MHVCQKWRCVVFGSQRRLNIQLACRPTTPVREMLDIWPRLPIVIQQHDDEPWQPIWGGITSLWHSSIRSVCSALLPRLFPIALEMVLAAMLTDLWPRSRFIFGWIGPGRRYLQLQRISFQGLPELLSIAAHLTDLRFLNIPRNGYISPEGMITSIFALTMLEELTIEVGSSPQSSRESSPESQRSPPPTRALVLVLFPTST